MVISLSLIEIRDSNAVDIEAYGLVFEVDIHTMVFFCRGEQESIQVGARYRINLLFGVAGRNSASPLRRPRDVRSGHAWVRALASTRENIPACSSA